MCAAGTGYRAAHTHVRIRARPAPPGTHEGGPHPAVGPPHARAPSPVRTTRGGRPRGSRVPRYYAVAAAASAAWARSARSTPARDSDISRRSAAFGSAEASQASVASSVSWETWMAG